MFWDFLKKKKDAKSVEASKPEPQAETKARAVVAEPEPAKQPAEAAATDEKALEKQIEQDLNRLEPGMAAQLKNPAVRQKLLELARKMIKDGVDIKSEKAVKNWIKDHPEALGGPDQPKVETFVRPEPKVGRNDPCPCGSGKKHKKCCGQK